MRNFKSFINGCKNEDENKHIHIDYEIKEQNVIDQGKEVQNFDDFEDAKSGKSVDDFVDAVNNLSTTDDSIVITGKSESDRWDVLSNDYSSRSLSTSATIEPQVIHLKVKKSLNKRDKLLTRQRCLAKGEASAVTRKRNENRDLIKEYSNVFSAWE